MPPLMLLNGRLQADVLSLQIATHEPTEAAGALPGAAGLVQAELRKALLRHNSSFERRGGRVSEPSCARADQSAPMPWWAAWGKAGGAGAGRASARAPGVHVGLPQRGVTAHFGTPRSRGCPTVHGRRFFVTGRLGAQGRPMCTGGACQPCACREHD
jgi:hypothetical protein